MQKLELFQNEPGDRGVDLEVPLWVVKSGSYGGGGGDEGDVGVVKLGWSTRSGLSPKIVMTRCGFSRIQCSMLSVLRFDVCAFVWVSIVLQNTASAGCDELLAKEAQTCGVGVEKFGLLCGDVDII